MRRIWLVLIPPLALIFGVSAAVLVTDSPDLPASSPASTSPMTNAGDLSAPPSAHVPLPLPELDLPPLEPDPAWWRASSAPGSIGVIWVSREGSDPSGMLENGTQRELYERLVECFPEGATNEELYQGKIGCFDERVIRSAASTPNPTDVFAAIRALNTARPDVFTVCHNASHKVGEIALKRIIPVYGVDTDIIAALLDRGANACMGGLMHGTLDAIGLLVSDVEAFTPAVDACLLANPENLGYCTDAVGHATWDAFKDIPKAATVCSFFKTASSRRECGEGILMRIYQREEPNDPWFLGNITNDRDLLRWNEDIAKICQSWPSTPFSAAAPEDPREWCWSGAVYLLFKPLFYSIESRGGKVEEAYDELSARLSLAIKTCSSFPTPGDDLCLGRMGPSVGHIAAFEREYAEKLCQLFPTTSAVERCTKDAFMRIDDAFSE